MDNTNIYVCDGFISEVTSAHRSVATLAHFYMFYMSQVSVVHVSSFLAGCALSSWSNGVLGPQCPPCLCSPALTCQGLADSGGLAHASPGSGIFRWLTGLAFCLLCGAIVTLVVRASDSDGTSVTSDKTRGDTALQPEGSSSTSASQFSLTSPVGTRTPSSRR